MSKPEPVFITRKDASRQAGLCESHIANLVRTGVIASVLIPDGLGHEVRRISRRGFEAWVAAGCPRPSTGGPAGFRKGTGLGVGEIALRLGVCRPTVIKWIDAGVLESFREHGLRRVHEETLDGFRTSPDRRRKWQRFQKVNSTE